jgi:hypothetical protein
MTQDDLDEVRSLRIKLCLEGHSHVVELGLTYGPYFKQHWTFSDAITSISCDEDPFHHQSIQSIELLWVLSAVQEHEDLVLAHVHVYGDSSDDLEIEQACRRFDAELIAYLDLAHRIRIQAGGLTDAEKIRHELSRRGLGGNQVVSTARAGLDATLNDRRRHRQHLRTPDGHAYLRTLAPRKGEQDPKYAKSGKATIQATRLPRTAQ